MGFNIRGRFKERKYSYQKNRKNKNKKEQKNTQKSTCETHCIHKKYNISNYKQHIPEK